MGVALTIDGVFPDAEHEAAFVADVEALVHTYTRELSTAKLTTDFSGSVELPVGEPPQELTISGTLTPATIGAPFHATLQASGGTAPYVWLADGLVDGLYIDSATGAITGTPNVAGAAIFHVAVHDSADPANAASEDFSIIVGGPVSDEDKSQDEQLAALETKVEILGNNVATIASAVQSILDKLNEPPAPPAQ